MSEAAVAVLDHSVAKPSLTVRGVTTALLGLFAFDNLLLLHFWGLPLSATVALAFAAASAFWFLCRGISRELPAIPLRTAAWAFVISVALFALGGEGRFFYANTDWQIRDAVLRDMAINPWPYAYALDGSGYFLRAPIGTYLLPAMFDERAELALLFYNSLRLTLLLTLGWHLFARKRDRAIGLAVFLLFSGWDIVGTALYWNLGIPASWDHLERWNFNHQFSSHITQAFWVPQHAIAGWACAITFLLWRKGLVPLGVFAASVPLVALWSPLAIMGAVPFAVFAGIVSLRHRTLAWTDFASAALGLAVAIPALLYLKVDAADVGMHPLPFRALVWLFGVGLEVLPFALPLLFARRSSAIDRPVILLTTLVLLPMQLIQIGNGADFEMRASIMPLAVLSIAFAQWICSVVDEKPVRVGPLSYALVALGLGAATPLFEMRRTLTNRPSPKPLCSLIGAYTQQDNSAPYSIYLARVSSLPLWLRGVPVVAGRGDPERCWASKWVVPTPAVKRND